MVQQVASLKTGSAASALPFSASVKAFNTPSATGQTFNNELLRQFKQSNVYQQPVQPKLPLATQSSPEQANVVTQTASKYDQQRDQNLQKQTQQHNDRDAQFARQRANNDERNKLMREGHSASKNNDNPRNQTSRSLTTLSVNNAQEKNHDIQTQGASTTIARATDKVDGVEAMGRQANNNLGQVSGSPNNIKDERNTSSVNTLVDTSDADSPVYAADDPNEFNYIDYVTQLADFTNSSKSQSEISAGETLALNADEIEDIVSPNTEINNPAEDIIDTIKLIDVDDGLRVNISEQERQIIIDAQASLKQGDTELKPSELAKIKQVVDNLLEQIGASKVDNSDNSETTTAVDKALLQGLLMNKDSLANDDSVNKALIAKAGVDATTLPSALSVTNDMTTNAAPDEIGDAIPEVLMKDNTISDKKSTLANESALVKSGVNVDTKTTLATFPIDKLAGLNEEQSSLALENITQRLQSVLPELSSQNNSHAFIAALQTSVKEYNQQIAQGQEPNSDLQSMITEALAASNVEVTDAKQPKIDAAISQFNAVLNLANAVNYSANQLQPQLVGLSEHQFSKEMNQQYIEGTKFANNANNQLNAQASNEKAVNIFKQEGQHQLAEKVRWMVNARNPSAEIRLDPPDLGGINIKINLSGDTAQVNFNVQSMAAKDALDQAVPKLREMLQQHGIELGQSSVQQDSAGHKQNARDGEFSQGNGTASSKQLLGENTPDVESTQVIEQAVSGGTLGGIDYYA